jgi:predicted alpha/beta hydrolase family esterase
MKSKDATILVLPGLGGGTAEHWYNRWVNRHGSMERVEQPDFWKPDPGQWTANLHGQIGTAQKPVILIAHSAGVATVAHAFSGAETGGKVLGAFLVAAPDVANMPERGKPAEIFHPLPEAALPFPSVLVASRNDPYCGYARSEELAKAWDATLIDAGDAGHINADSGHGAWPEGALRFATFLSGIEARTVH